MKGYPFNVRVYGMLIEKEYLLLADELIGGNRVTKLPGGGLEFGEGTRDCLAREFLEETGTRIKTAEHLYTTDYFQPSRLNNRFQVISIFYRVKSPDPLSNLHTSQKPFDFQEGQRANAESFRWLPLSQLSPSIFTWPVERRLVEVIQAGKLL